MPGLSAVLPLLAGLCLLTASSTVQAQTAFTLVSNFNQSTSNTLTLL